MPSAGSYDVRTAHHTRDAEVARLAAQARLGWDKEVASLERFGFRDGMSILELGSGPGFVTKLLTDRFPTGRVTCLEVDASLIEDATRYLGDDASRVTFLNASVTETGLAPDAYDAAYARLLFQHLPDPAAAAKETFRILRPGAPFVVADADDRIGFLIDPDVPAFRSIHESFVRAQASRGGNRYVGGSLPRILKRAGFEQVDIDVVSTNSEAEGLDPFLLQLDPARLSP